MCGIVGYVGKKECAPVLIAGLTGLEYRGYDSAGIATIFEDAFQVRKASGRLCNLEEELHKHPVSGHVGIGHTRWATHGKPSVVNCHPHCDHSGRVAVVHNGIIENYLELKEMLMRQGIVFRTETDTEVVAQLLGYYDQGDMLATLQKVLPMLQGSFALGILSLREPEKIFAVRLGCPLIVGSADGASYLGSDVSALLEYTRDMFILEDLEIAVLQEKGIAFYHPDGTPLEKKSLHISWSASAAQKDGFDHFMLKEIYEQPQVLLSTLKHYVEEETFTFRWDTLPFTKEQALNLERITIVACGTAYHAGMMCKAMIERLARIKVEADIASEYRYSETMSGEGETLIAVSQSGETADTIAALRKAKERGHRVIALTNVIGSSVARESDAVMYTLAGPEIAVASTKAYSTQVLLFAVLAVALAQLRGQITAQESADYLRELFSIPGKVDAILDCRPQVEAFARQQISCKDIFFIGRQMDYYTSLEAALKLKEISYLHSEAYAAGELKHGTIALIDDSTLVVAIATQEKIIEKTMSNVQEVVARGATILLVTSHPELDGAGIAERWLVPQGRDLFLPMLTMVYMQLFAYYMALQKGCDIDKPRNLAKSVTVE